MTASAASLNSTSPSTLPACDWAYDPGDPYVHYAFALAFGKKGEQDGTIETYAAARKHFRAMLELNSDLEEAAIAKRNLAAIDSALNAAK